MGTEVISPAEQEKSSPPTTLHLFRYKGSELASLQTRVSAVLQLEKNYHTTELSLGTLRTAKDARLDRLAQTGEELSEQLDNTKSSITCGAVYLKMRAELPSLSPKDFMEFFNLCVKSNTLLNQQFADSVNTRGGETTLLRSISIMNTRKISSEYEKILYTMAHNRPEWFGNSKRAWELFVMSHANFTPYLRSDLLERLVPRRLSAVTDAIGEFSKGSYGPTKEGEYPDWLLENGEIIPTKEEVEEELAEDKEQEIKTFSALEKIEEQENYLQTTSIEKTQKALARLSDLTKEAFPNIQNFADLILFKKVSDEKSDILLIKSDSIEMAINSYTHPENIIKNHQPIALYIEKKLLEGKIIQSTQDPIDANFTDLFVRLLESLQEKGESSLAKFQELQNTNKKAFGTLNYDIKPFLEVLSVSELSFLQELLREYSGTAIEEFIWDMAGLISSHFKKESLQPTKSQRGALHYLSRFTASFLRNHSKFAYGELQKSSQDNFFEQEELKPKDSVVTASLQEEIESITEELAQGNLAGWQIFYTDNKTSDEKHLKEIGGKTLEERELALQEFFVKQGVSSSIKQGSIIRALDWLVTVPENIEQLRIRKDIGGEIFKKLKRANLRIFYKMVTSEKKFTFFVHQKQAWNYGF